jgi:hypothetical protein
VFWKRRRRVKEVRDRRRILERVQDRGSLNKEMTERRGFCMLSRKSNHQRFHGLSLL